MMTTQHARSAMGMRVMAGVVAVCAAMAVPLSARIERATFVLTDGKRISGTLVFHTSERANFRPDKAEFNVGIGNHEQAIPSSQIVMIEFVGGQPATAELQALGTDPTLVMLDGRKLTGHLLDFIGGDTIKWQEASGSTSTYPVRDAKRIYMQPDRVLAMYHVTRAASSASSDTSGTSGSSATPRTGGTSTAFAVPGTSAWVNTGIMVQEGQLVRFVTTGGVRIRENGPLLTAEGDAGTRSASYPVPTFPGGGLIARIGNNQPFPMGQRADEVAMPQTGVLYIGINDDNLSDNSGSFRVAIVR